MTSVWYIFCSVSLTLRHTLRNIFPTTAMVTNVHLKVCPFQLAADVIVLHSGYRVNKSTKPYFGNVTVA